MALRLEEPLGPSNAFVEDLVLYLKRKRSTHQSCILQVLQHIKTGVEKLLKDFNCICLRHYECKVAFTIDEKQPGQRNPGILARGTHTDLVGDKCTKVGGRVSRA